MNAIAGWRELSDTLDGVVCARRMRAAEHPVLFIHGVGPGTTGEINFAPVLDRLSPRCAPHLIDLAGFGASGRLPRTPSFDPDFWSRQIETAVRDIIRRHGRAPVLVGNSVGGALALRAAAALPEVSAVLALGVAASDTPTVPLRAFWTAPASPDALAAALRPMTANPHMISGQTVAARFAPFRDPAYVAYFGAMLGDHEACLAALRLPADAAARVRARVTVLHGRDDRAFPVAGVLRCLPLPDHADIVLLGSCGHAVPQDRAADVAVHIDRIIEETAGS